MVTAKAIIREIDRAKTIDELREVVRKMTAVARRSRIPKPAAPGATKEGRDLERRIRLNVAVKVVVTRAGGKCEACGRSDLRLEIDHLESGGLRRHRESAETMMHLCVDCHRAKHRGDLGKLRAMKETCLRLFMRDGLRAVEHRIAKVEEARRTA